MSSFNLRNRKTKEEVMSLYRFDVSNMVRKLFPKGASVSQSLPYSALDPLAQLYLQYEPYIRYGRQIYG